LDSADRPPAVELSAEEEDSAAVAPAPSSADVEKELLAGIEEFRNQLAQLKGGVAEEPAAAQPATVQTT
jgi:hypothetical protein